jgi:hypothetical protein
MPPKLKIIYTHWFMISQLAKALSRIVKLLRIQIADSLSSAQPLARQINQITNVSVSLKM